MTGSERWSIICQNVQISTLNYKISFRKADTPAKCKQGTRTIFAPPLGPLLYVRQPSKFKSALAGCYRPAPPACGSPEWLRWTCRHCIWSQPALCSHGSLEWRDGFSRSCDLDLEPVTFTCIIVSTVGWTWWDWSLILSTYLPSVLWHCWLGHLTRKNPSPIWPIMCLVGR